MNHSAAAIIYYIPVTRLLLLRRYLICLYIRCSTVRACSTPTAIGSGRCVQSLYNVIVARYSCSRIYEQSYKCTRRPSQSYIFSADSHPASWSPVQRTVESLSQCNMGSCMQWDAFAPNLYGRLDTVVTCIAFVYNECHHMSVVAHSHTQNSFFLPPSHHIIQ
jgi:hypothetical protein